MSNCPHKRNLRLADEDDLDTILEIINATNRIFYKAIVPAEQFRDPFFRLEDLVEEFNRRAFYLFEVDGEPVGVAAFEVRPGGAAVMNRLYVLPDFQGQGIGSALVSHVEALARRRGLDEILIWTDPKAAWAVSFYKHLGYAEIDRGTTYGDPLIDSRIAKHPRELLVLHKRLSGEEDGGTKRVP
jgi:GNAT superfamily N-acetyltransferase